MTDYTHYRKGAKVYTVDGDTLEFNGTPENAGKEVYNDSYTENKRGTKIVKTNARYYVNRGINAAKRYVRSNGLVSYNA